MSSKPKPKKKPAKKSTPTSKFSAKKWGIFIGLFLVVIVTVLWSSLFKAYPVEGKKQLLAIGQGDSYSSLIDRWSKESKIHFPIILKLYQ